MQKITSLARAFRSALLALAVFLTLAAMPAQATETVLVGNTSVQSDLDSNTGGTAEAFKYTAVASGYAYRAYVYLDSAWDQPSQIRIGVYSDNNGAPGTRLSEGVLSNPGTGWVLVGMNMVGITQGTVYWLSIMSPSGDTPPYFRDFYDGSGPTNAYVSSSTSLSTHPATWSSGTGYPSAPASLYLTTLP